MRITFVLPSVSLSGGIRVVAIYAERLQRRGHDVLLVSPPKRQASLREQLRSLRRGDGWILSRNEPSHLDGVDIRHHVLDRHRPVTDADLPDADVVIATWWETARWVNKLSPRKGAKVYFIQHHETHDYFPKAAVSATYLMPMHKIVVAPWLVDVMTTRYQDKNVSLVANSVDTELFHAPPRGKRPLPTFGMIYSTTPWKGSDIALEAFDLFTREKGRARLHAFGMGHISSRLPLPPESTYTRQPPQSRLREIYARCDAWLFSSRIEGFGLPILEAMACRTPVIGTPVGAAPQLITRVNGRLVPAESPRALARAMVEIAEMPAAHWLAMSKNAYQSVQDYTWEEATDLFVAALRTACRSRGPSRLSIRP